MKIVFAAEKSQKVKLCSLYAGVQSFGVETGEVQEVLGRVRPQLVPRAPKFVAGVIAYRGEVITAVSLPALLGLQRSEEPLVAVVMRNDEMREQFALLVDSFADVVEVDQELWEPNPLALDERKKTLYSGVYRMEGATMVRLESNKLQPSRLLKVVEKAAA
jgi:purine-binding chemotaxis protein CheW